MLDTVLERRKLNEKVAVIITEEKPSVHSQFEGCDRFINVSFQMDLYMKCPDIEVKLNCELYTVTMGFNSVLN